MVPPPESPRDVFVPMAPPGDVTPAALAATTAAMVCAMSSPVAVTATCSVTASLGRAPPFLTVIAKVPPPALPPAGVPVTEISAKALDGPIRTFLNSASSPTCSPVKIL